jgi:hypothetical protein
MTRNLVSFAAAALLAGLSLTACNSSAEEAQAGNNLTEAKAPSVPANLPPAIQTSRTYRCADNSVVFVDFLTDGTAAIRTDELGTPTRLTPDDGRPPFKAEGYSVAANEGTTSIAVPGKSAQTCRART